MARSSIQHCGKTARARVSDDQDRRAIRLELTTTMRCTLSEVFDDMLSTWTRGEAERFTTML
jgi:hypothetical protein